MIPRPHYTQPGCVYYICLLRDELLLRQGACGSSNGCHDSHQIGVHGSLASAPFKHSSL